MSYRAALLRRWSRRDVLAVLVVAASVAFLTGSGLVGHAASTELAGVAADFEPPASVTHYDDPSAARAAATEDAVVFPLARGEMDGRTVTVVGVPEDASSFAPESELRLPSTPPPGRLRGPAATSGEATVNGASGSVTVQVEPRAGDSVFPERWYVASPDIVSKLGPTEAIVLTPGDGPTPVVGVLSFFLLGSRQVLRAVALATAGAGLLLGVTVFAATRMTVRDRLETIRVARATGARPRTLVGLFAVRGALQAAAGVAGGYAVGVIGPNAAVNAAVFLGRPSSLSLQVTRQLVGVLVPAYLGLVGVGALGGALAAVPAVRRQPATLTGRAAPAERRLRVPAVMQTELLDWRAVVPTGATLAVFLVVAVLAASTAGVVAPLSGGDGTTITEPGAAHPFASVVPQQYATELRVQGTPASAEILALGVVEGDPFVARGANFSAFRSVTDAAVQRGRQPRRAGEAIVGVDLARTLGLSVGDRLYVGGSTRPAVEQLRVVGTYTAPEPYDDQLVVPLATARRLSSKPPGRVQFVRTAERPEAPSVDGASVVGVQVPSSTVAGGTIAVTATVLNPTESADSITVRASIQDASVRESIELSPGERRSVVLQLPAGGPRTATVTVAGRDRTVEVVDPQSLRLQGLPETAPSDSRPLVRVTTATGQPVVGATVEVAGTTARTNSEGWARLPLGEPGRVQVNATADNRSTSAEVAVRDGIRRRPELALSITPETPTPATRPRASVDIWNRWNRTITANIIVEGQGTKDERVVELGPGERTEFAVQLTRQPAGEYTVTVTDGGDPVASTTYEVEGDPRLGAALATSGRAGATTGVGQSLSIVLGNLELVVGTVLGLAAMMTVGGTTAAFASAVQARRRTLGVHRAMGATPRAVLALVLRDAVRIALAATTLGLVLAGVTLLLLDRAGVLTLYGVRVLTTVDPGLVASIAAAAFALAVVGAALATIAAIRGDPSRLLSGTGASGGPQGRTGR